MARWGGGVLRWGLLLLLGASVAHAAGGISRNVLLVVCNQVYAHTIDGRMVIGLDTGRRIAPTTYYQVLGDNTRTIWHADFEFEIPGGGEWIRTSSPLWAPPALLAMACALVWWPRFRWRRKDTCRRCGYSMTGLSDGTACPECGGTSRD